MLRYLLTHPLAKRHPLRALYRIATWQIRYRILSQSFVLIPFIEPSKLLLQPNEQAAIGNWYYGLVEFEMMSFLLHFLQTGDLFVDVGANIGSYSILAAGVSKAKAIAIEPIPATFAKLKQNILLNQLESYIQPHFVGLAEEPGHLHFTTSKGQQNHVVPPGDQMSSIAVSVNTLDNIIVRQDPILLKIDAEGYETAIIRGGVQTLAKPTLKALILETMGLGKHYGFDENQLQKKIQVYGFQAYTYDPFKRELKVQRELGHQTLYLRDFDMVNERVKSAKPFKVFGEQI